MRKALFEVISSESTGADGHRAILKPVADVDKTADDLSAWGDAQVVITNVNAEGVKALQPGDRFNVQLTQAKSSATETAGAAAADADTAKPAAAGSK